MTQRLTLWIAVSLIVGVAASFVAAKPTRPVFSSVVRHGDSIVAVVAGGRWLTHGDSPSGRIIEAGQSLTFRDGTSVTLVQHHTSYDIRCQISPSRAGLHVTESFDARSFGAAAEQQKYFIRAQ